jgi:hypothetical protein
MRDVGSILPEIVMSMIFQLKITVLKIQQGREAQEAV